MPKLPVVATKKLVKALEKIGFYQDRSRGSHLVMINRDGRRTIIPMHSRDIPSGTLLAILKDLNILKGDLVKLL